MAQLVLIQSLRCLLYLAVDEAVEDADTAEPNHKVDAHEDGGVGSTSNAVKAAGADYRHQDIDLPEGAKLPTPTTQVLTRASTMPLALKTWGKSFGWAMRR